MIPIREFRISRHGSLPIGEIHELRNILNNGGLCVLPSDTCYALAGIPFVVGVTDAIDQICARKGEKISLAFGSLLMAERYVELKGIDYKVIDNFMPGPVTLVAQVRQEADPALVSRLLHTNGTMGVRIPDSAIERQLSVEVDRPVTTVAIYYENHTGVRSFEDAVEIVAEGVERLDRPIRLAAIRHPTVRAGDVSTVVERANPNRDAVDVREQPLIVHREGAVDAAKLVRATQRWQFRDVEDWT